MTTRKTTILTVASISVFFEALDIAIINLAMPLIQQQFKLGNDEVQWLQTLYVLLYGGFLIIGGKLADVVGRKKIFMLGSALFLLTSLGAALSTRFEILALFRAAQGIAAAFIMPSALSIITNTFTEEKERSYAIGIFSSFAAIGSGSGLSLGGLVASHFGWQAVFYINVPIISMTLILATLYIDRDVVDQSKRIPDIFSGLLIALALITLSYAINLTGNLSKNTIIVLALSVFVSLLIYWFIHRLKTQPVPFVKTALFQSSETLLGNSMMLVLGAFFTGFLFIVSLLLQNNMHYSAAWAGLLLFPFSILSALVAKFLLPILLKRISIFQGAIAGMMLMVAGASVLLCAMSFGNNLILLLAAFACVTGVGMSICFTTFTVISVQPIPKEHHGLASSLSATSYFFGAGLGLSLLSITMNADSTNIVTRLPVMTLLLYALLGMMFLLIAGIGGVGRR